MKIHDVEREFYQIGFICKSAEATAVFLEISA
jgi:hypothetical protein